MNNKNAFVELTLHKINFLNKVLIVIYFIINSDYFWRKNYKKIE